MATPENRAATDALNTMLDSALDDFEQIYYNQDGDETPDVDDYVSESEQEELAERLAPDAPDSSVTD